MNGMIAIAKELSRIADMMEKEYERKCNQDQKAEGMIRSVFGGINLD